MSLLKHKASTIQNLGELASIFTKINNKHSNISDDLAAFGAPSECGIMAYRALDRELENAQTEMESKFGINYEQLLNEIARRTSYKIVYNMNL